MEIFEVLLGLILSSVIYIVLRWCFERHRIQQLLRKHGIPGPKPGFFDGNMYDLKREPTPHNMITSWLKKYGDVFGYYMGGEPFVVIRDLELLKKIMIKDFNYFVNRPKIFLDYGPFPKTLAGLRDKRWKEVRSIISPMFSSSKMKLMTDIIARKTDIIVDLVTRKSKDGEMFEMYSMTQGLTLDVIAACALAMKTKCQVDQNDDLLVSVRNMFKFQYNKGTELGVIFPFITKLVFLLDVFTPFGKAVNGMIDHVRIVVKERRQNSELRSLDILQALIDQSDTSNIENDTNLSEEEVLANAMVVFIAGYETTATTLGFIFYLLVKYPEIQDRLYEEIQNAEDASYATVQGLQYMDQVFNESLRLYPPVTGFITRTCSKDYKCDSFTIPEGAHVMAAIWDIHHDPDLWPDPWKFDPERFNPANKSSIKSMSYIPFGEGPRNCVGLRFALLEAKWAIFQLLKKFKFESCNKTESNLTLVTQYVITLPANGVWIKATPRM